MGQQKADTLQLAGAAVWDKLATSVAHATDLMTPDERADFWRGYCEAATKAVLLSYGHEFTMDLLRHCVMAAGEAAPRDAMPGIQRLMADLQQAPYLAH